MRANDVLAPTGGILRARRCPPGWTAGGPLPQPPAESARLGPRQGEDLCWLCGDWRLLQRTDGHRFSLDDLVTAHDAARWFVEEADGADGTLDRILDLGCGIGSVLLMLAWRFPCATLLGVEAQAISVEMARRSIAWNGAGPRCGVRAGDFRAAEVLAGEAPFALITGTPPYFPRGTGIESDEVQRGPCRFEHRGGIEDYAATAARHLAPDGWFVACAPANQPDRAEAAAEAAGLRVARRRDVVPRSGKAPLFTVFGLRSRQRTSRSPPRIEPPLVVRDSEGRRTDALVALRAAMGMPP